MQETITGSKEGMRCDVGVGVFSFIGNPRECLLHTHTHNQLLRSAEEKQGEKMSQTEKLAGGGCSSTVEHSPGTQEAGVAFDPKFYKINT